MKLMGLRASVHWISWFVTFMVYIIPAMAVYAILFAVTIVPDGPVLAKSSGSLFFVFLLVYSLALISFCFMVSTFVQKGKCCSIFFINHFTGYAHLDINTSTVVFAYTIGTQKAEKNMQ